MNTHDRLHELRKKFFNVAYVDSRTATFDLSSDTFPGTPDMLPKKECNRHELLRGLQKKIEEIWDTDLWLPLYNGRIADSLVSSLVRRNSIVCGNEIYMTLQAGIQYRGGRVAEFRARGKGRFSGNLDLEEFFSFYRDSRERIPFVQVTAPTLGGEPVSTENIRTLKSMLTAEGQVPLFLDGARYSENAYLSREYETDGAQPAVRQIVSDFCRCFEVISVSAKKVMATPMGGLMLFHNRDLYEQFIPLHRLMVGSQEWGGTTPDILSHMVKGLDRSVDEDRLRKRFLNMKRFVEVLVEDGIPVSAWGMSQLTINANQFLHESSDCEFAAQTLLCLLYVIGGIKAIGTFNRKSDKDGNPPEEVQLSFNREMVNPDLFMRLAGTIIKIHTMTRDLRIKGLRECEVRRSVLPFYRFFCLEEEHVWKALVSTDDGEQGETASFVNDNSSFGNAGFLSFKELILDSFAVNTGLDVIPAALERGPYYLIARSYLTVFPAGSLKISPAHEEKQIIEGLFHYLQSERCEEESNAGTPLIFRTLPENIQPGCNVIGLTDSDIRRLIKNGLPRDISEGNILYYCGNSDGNHLLPVSFLCIEDSNVLYKTIVSSMIYFMGSHEEGGLCGGLFARAYDILKSEASISSAGQ